MRAEHSTERCLQAIYTRINHLSSVMWGLGSLLKNRLRSADEGENDQWKKETNAQVGYGEITKGCMTRTFVLMQQITDLIPQNKHRMLIRPIEEYNMSEKSRFLDIGSGFGKPVFHAAVQIGCEAKGIEVVPIRAEFASNFLKTLASGKSSAHRSKWGEEAEEGKASGERGKAVGASGVKRKESAMELRSRAIKSYHSLSEKELKIKVPKKSSNKKQHAKELAVATRISQRKAKCEAKSKPHRSSLDSWHKLVSFLQTDASRFTSYKNAAGEDYTHIYSYNKVMTKETIKDVCRILNNTDYRVLAWYFNENETRKCGLKNFLMIRKVPMLTTGGQKFIMYLYVKAKPSIRSRN
eukprot:TRINITY_DN10568_c0_g3_i3.p1 TRINITY_DN10568_c0_g3~~TRINITY_DN10568_c0_g3_i3.p1  ORF type:complete len:353 (-),score=70.28 TRINITY_DN10568_c0_g3_i3:148-1206(-)